MMKKQIIFLLIGIFLLAMMTSCEQSEDDPDNIRIEGTILESPLIPVGVEGVVIDIAITAISAASEASITINDVAFTDKNGKFVYAKYLAGSRVGDDEEIEYIPIFEATMTLTFSFTDATGNKSIYLLQNVYVNSSEDRKLRPIYLTEFS